MNSSREAGFGGTAGNPHRELSNFQLVKLGGLGLSSLGTMNEVNQIEIIFEKV